MAEPVNNVAKMPTPARMPVAVDVNNPVALYLDTGVFEQLQRVAKLMVSSGLAPGHLKGEGKMADAFLVVAQAFRWGMDPFAVAQHTFVYQGKMGYEGKLIAAVVNASGKLKSPLNYRYEGAGDTRKVIVTGQFATDAAPREVEGTVREWKTGNEKWAKMPDQMLAYRGAREWARRHMPEVILGVNYADDEIPQMNIGPERAIDVTPRATPAAIDAALEAADESGREPSPVVDGMSVVASARTDADALREGTDSAATEPEWSDANARAIAAYVRTAIAPDALAEWERRTLKHFNALSATAKAVVRAAINDRKQEIAANA